MVSNEHVLVIDNVVGNSIFDFFKTAQLGEYALIVKIDDCEFSNIKWFFNGIIINHRIVDSIVDKSGQFTINMEDVIYLTFKSEEEMLYFKMKYGGESYYV